MYRRRQTAGCSIQLLIILGVLAGVAFVGYDYFRARSIESGGELASLPELPSGDSSAAEIVPPVDEVVAENQGNLVPVGDIINSETTRLFIPAAGIEAPITEVFLDGTSWDVSRLGLTVGHLQGTSWLDDGPGNIVLSGHVEMADGRKGVFATLNEIPVGEIIIVSRDGEERQYQVTEVKEVEPDDLTPLYPSTTEMLTLITCGSYNFISDEYEVRTVVVAERLS